MSAWDFIKEQLQSKISPQSYDNWIAKTSFDRIERNLLYVLVPNQQTKDWLESEYENLILPLTRERNLSGINYIVGNSHAAPDLPPREPECEAAGSQLNPKFTFGSFVVGACNQLAHAAAQAITTSPSRTYNPLFIYGGTGMGKTHLMHAMGRGLIDRYAGMRVVYTSSERFMNQMVSSIRLGRMAQFHQFYRSADALLVDDIHVLGNKERTQEEFFHTFNELYDHQKQIVISSDSPPKDIPGLVNRLRSRFEWGLIADMLPPDLETKMAILDKKAEAEGICLPEDVRAFIAAKTRSSVRELEGALVKLIAFSSLSNEPISLAMAHQALKHVTHAQERRISIDAIQKAVA